MRCGAPTGGRQTTTGFPFPVPTTDTQACELCWRMLLMREISSGGVLLARSGFLPRGGPAKVAPNATRGTQTRAVHEARTLHISTHRHHGRPRHPGAQAQRHDPRRLDRRHSHRSLRVPRRAGRPVQVIAPRARNARRGGGVRVRGEGKAGGDSVERGRRGTRTSRGRRALPSPRGRPRRAIHSTAS